MFKNNTIYPKQAVISVGGKGTRLKDISNDHPKPLVKINGLSTLERAVLNMSKQGIDEFILLIRYKSHLFIEEAERLKAKYQVEIKCHKENNELGEAGALFLIKENLEDTFIFLNGDIIFELDFKRVFNFFNFCAADLVLITHTSTHPHDSDCLIEGKNKEIIQWKRKEDKRDLKGFYLGNAGIAILKSLVIFELSKNKEKKEKKLSFFYDIAYKALNLKLKCFSYNTSEFIKDMGTKERFITAKKAINSYTLEKKSYKNKQKALFLDKDGTLINCINKEYNLNHKKEDVFKNRIKKIAKIAGKYQIVLLISNQPQISMGLCSWESINKLIGELIVNCLEHNLLIDGYYICPHHPHKGFKGELKELKTFCFCRKPMPGLFLEAAYLRNINLNESLFIGDSLTDEEAAKNAGVDFKYIQTFD